MKFVTIGDPTKIRVSRVCPRCGTQYSPGVWCPECDPDWSTATDWSKAMVEHSVKPLVGVMPEWRWRELRVRDLVLAATRFADYFAQNAEFVNLCITILTNAKYYSTTPNGHRYHN